MIIRAVVILAACAVIVLGQTAPSPAQKGGTKQPAAGQYQRPATAVGARRKRTSSTSSTKLQQESDLDYGAMLEQRRQAFLAASGANPFFWYSALTTAILMVLMFAYGVRVMDEKRKLWHAAEILNDVWNDAQYARATAEDAIGRHNAHMETCNRVIEAQTSGRPSPCRS